MHNNNIVSATNARPSTCVDIRGAVDVDIAITIPGATSWHCDECGAGASPCGERDCDHDNADIVSVLYRQQVTLCGSVTLVPRDGRMVPFGDAVDHWISSALLTPLQALPLMSAEWHATILDIENAAVIRAGVSW
jgi:hypothetical protein